MLRMLYGEDSEIISAHRHLRHLTDDYQATRGAMTFFLAVQRGWRSVFFGFLTVLRLLNLHRFLFISLFCYCYRSQFPRQ